MPRWARGESTPGNRMGRSFPLRKSHRKSLPFSKRPGQKKLRTGSSVTARAAFSSPVEAPAMTLGRRAFLRNLPWIKAYVYNRVHVLRIYKDGLAFSVGRPRWTLWSEEPA